MGDTQMTGPAKGILQLMSCITRNEGTFLLANCLVNGADSLELASKFSEQGINVQELRHPSRNYFDLMQQASSVVRQHGIKIVQTHGYKQSFVGIYLKFRYNLKWVCFLHGTTTETFIARIYHKIDNLLQRFANRTVIVAEKQREKIFGGSDAHRVRVLNNSVDLEKPVAFLHGGEKTRRALGVSDEFLFAVIGRLSPEKGVDLFLRAFALLLRQQPCARAVIVGNGTEMDNLLKLCDKLILNEYLKFTGYIPEAGDFMDAADALVLPSRSEGFPNVILEAMAIGTPVVATDVGGVSEIIDADISGVLVDEDSPEALLKGMLKIMHNASLRKKLAANGLKRIRETYSPNKRSDRLYSLYLELTEDHDVHNFKR